MKLLEIGKLFKDGITRYKEGIKFDITDGGCNLLIYYADPSEEEKKDITKGSFKYGYFREGNVILMLFRFGEQQWMDAPYSVHLSKNLTKLQGITEAQGFALNIYLINANSGIIEGMRLVGLNERLSKMLKEDIVKQNDLIYDGFDIKLNEVYRKYTTKALVSMAKILV